MLKNTLKDIDAGNPKPKDEIEQLAMLESIFNDWFLKSPVYKKYIKLHRKINKEQRKIIKVKLSDDRITTSQRLEKLEDKFFKFFNKHQREIELINRVASLY